MDLEYCQRLISFLFLIRQIFLDLFLLLFLVFFVLLLFLNSLRHANTTTNTINVNIACNNLTTIDVNIKANIISPIILIICSNFWLFSILFLLFIIFRGWVLFFYFFKHWIFFIINFFIFFQRSFIDNSSFFLLSSILLSFA